MESVKELRHKLDMAIHELKAIKAYCESCGKDALPEADIVRSINKLLEEHIGDIKELTFDKVIKEKELKS